jgi:hypothetical protein
MTTLTQKAPPAGFILSEANGERSRDNYLLSHGKTLGAGEVAKVEDAVDLTTNATTHTNTTLDSLVSVVGLVVGDIYAVTGTGIPAGTTFTYGGSSAGTLSAAATASATVSCHFTRPLGIGPWLTVSDSPAGVSIYDADATAGAIMASLIARDAEVNLKRLVFPDSSDADVVSDLAGLGIICRD